MKKLNLFIATLLISFFTCFSFADLAPIYNGKICNIITNLDEYLKDYYMVIGCGSEGCDGNGSFNIFKHNTKKCLPGWGSVYLIPNDIEFESLELMKRWGNKRYLDDKRDIQIGMIRDKSENGDLTHIYEIKQNGTGIKLELVKEYKGYNVQNKMNKNSKKSRNNPYSATLLNPVILEKGNGVLRTDCCEIKTTDRKDNIIIAGSFLILYIILFVIYYIINYFKKINYPIRKSLIDSLISIVIISIIILGFLYSSILTF